MILTERERENLESIREGYERTLNDQDGYYTYEDTADWAMDFAIPTLLGIIDRVRTGTVTEQTANL